MYGWIWRKLPGGLWGKLTGSIVLTAAVGTLLWYVVFPWATPLLPFDDVQVGTEQTQQDPNAVPGADDPGLGPDDIPYSTHSNEPAPSPSNR
ncbi:hypothetical protein [Krasilnikovia sp. M28-CT-15]|uniref:hypothetical protein n=1 Tax=Krasilnikovia sp. M28-CT-15 TaxID=3373540 RepID=UPI003876CA06